MFQSVGSLNIAHLFESELAEGTARGSKQYLVDFVATLAHQTLEYGRVLAVYRQDVDTIFIGQLTNQFASHNQCFLVGKADGLASLYGVYCRRQSGITHHSCEHHVDGLCLYNLVESLRSGIDLHFGAVSQQRLESFVVLFVGYDYSRRAEFSRLFGQFHILIVGREAVSLVSVGMLLDYVQGLSADRTGRAEDANLFFHISIFC